MPSAAIVFPCDVIPTKRTPQRPLYSKTNLAHAGADERHEMCEMRQKADGAAIDRGTHMSPTQGSHQTK